VTKSSKNQSEKQPLDAPEKDFGLDLNQNDVLMILKNQKVIMRGMFIIMKSMAGDMEVAEEIKAQAKLNYDYITSREPNDEGSI
jgi:hypothetical protein